MSPTLRPNSASLRAKPQAVSMAGAAIPARILRPLFPECKPDGKRDIPTGAKRRVRGTKTKTAATRGAGSGGFVQSNPPRYCDWMRRCETNEGQACTCTSRESDPGSRVWVGTSVGICDGRFDHRLVCFGPPMHYIGRTNAKLDYSARCVSKVQLCLHRPVFSTRNSILAYRPGREQVVKPRFFPCFPCQDRNAVCTRRGHLNPSEPARCSGKRHGCRGPAGEWGAGADLPAADRASLLAIPDCRESPPRYDAR